MVAFAAGALTGRPRLAAAVTGAAFTAVKLSPTAALVASPFLGGVPRQDATDLLAFMVLWPCLRMARGRSRGGSAPRLGFMALQAGAVTVLLFGVTATSCDSSQVGGLAVSGTIVEAPLLQSRPLAWATSSDGGVTWSEVPTPSVSLTDLLGPKTEACAGSRCFRVVRNERVEERDAGSEWRRSFAFSAEERDQIRRGGSGVAGCPGSSQLFTEVVTVTVGASTHVVVAMGGEGVLHRLLEGQWERRKVLAASPISLEAAGRVRLLGLCPLVLVLLGLLLLPFARGDTPRRRTMRQGALLALSSGLGLLIVGKGATFLGFDPLLVGFAAAFVSFLLFLASVFVALVPR